MVPYGNCFQYLTRLLTTFEKEVLPCDSAVNCAIWGHHNKGIVFECVWLVDWKDIRRTAVCWFHFGPCHDHRSCLVYLQFPFRKAIKEKLVKHRIMWTTCWLLFYLWCFVSLFSFCVWPFQRSLVILAGRLTMWPHTPKWQLVCRQVLIQFLDLVIVTLLRFQNELT